MLCQLSMFVCAAQLLSSASLPISLGHCPSYLSVWLPGQVTSSPVPPWSLTSGHCFHPCPSARVQGHPPIFTRATSCGSAGLSLVSQTSSRMCLRLHKPCVGLGTAGTEGVLRRAGWHRRGEQQRLLWGLTHLRCCQCLHRVRFLPRVPAALPAVPGVTERTLHCGCRPG